MGKLKYEGQDDIVGKRKIQKLSRGKVWKVGRRKIWKNEEGEVYTDCPFFAPLNISIDICRECIFQKSCFGMSIEGVV
jgi:hypothetical protein